MPHHLFHVHFSPFERVCSFQKGVTVVRLILMTVLKEITIYPINGLKGRFYLLEGSKSTVL